MRPFVLPKRYEIKMAHCSFKSFAITSELPGINKKTETTTIRTPKINSVTTVLIAPAPFILINPKRIRTTPVRSKSKYQNPIKPPLFVL